MPQDIIARGMAGRALAQIGNAYGGDLYALLAREGEPVTLYGSGSASCASGSINTPVVSSFGGSSLRSAGKALWVESLNVQVDNLCLVQPLVGQESLSRFPQLLWQGVAGPSAPLVFPVRMLLRPHEIGSAAALNVRQVIGASGSTTVTGAMTLSGWRITDDLAFEAEKTVLFVGDSILNGTGPSNTANVWAFLFRDYLRALGVHARVVLKSLSGSTTSDHETFRAAGYHDIAAPDLIVYTLGVNDAGGAVSGSAYTSNLTAFWSWASKRYPDAKMVICGVTPLENNTSEANAATLRSAASSYVSGVADSRLKYINLGSAFDRTVSSNYVGSDPAGSRVHPNDTGHAAIANTFNTAWDTLDINL